MRVFKLPGLSLLFLSILTLVYFKPVESAFAQNDYPLYKPFDESKLAMMVSCPDTSLIQGNCQQCSQLTDYNYLDSFTQYSLSQYIYVKPNSLSYFVVYYFSYSKQTTYQTSCLQSDTIYPVLISPVSSDCPLSTTMPLYGWMLKIINPDINLNSDINTISIQVRQSLDSYMQHINSVVSVNRGSLFFIGYDTAGVISNLMSYYYAIKYTTLNQFPNICLPPKSLVNYQFGSVHTLLPQLELIWY